MCVNTFAILLSVFVAAAVDRASADELTVLPNTGRALINFYDQIANNSLNLEPFYKAVGMRVSNDVCDIGAPESARQACRRDICPMAEKIGLRIYCLYRSDRGIDRSDLLIDGPPPVATLADYDNAWNVFQFLALEKKSGALGQLGLLRTLSIPGYERSGFFELKPIEETLDGKVQAERWRHVAKLSTANCSTVLCISINALKLPDELTSSLATVLAECVRRRVEHVLGAPQYCVPIYFEGSKGTYISALTSFRNENMSVSAGMISARIYFTPRTNSDSFEAVSRLLETALAQPPLSFAIQRDPDAIVGVSGKRLSAVLPNNWHEQVTVRAVVSDIPLSVSDPGRTVQSLSGIQVGFATTLYVNNRNTLDDSEWRMPSRDQDQAFDLAVMSAVKAQAFQICPDVSLQTNDQVLIIKCRTNGW